MAARATAALDLPARVQPLSLEGAINQGLLDNPSLRLASFRSDAVATEVPLAESAFRPSISPLAQAQFGNGGSVTQLGIQAQDSFLTGTRILGSVFNQTDSANGRSSRIGSTIQLEQSVFRNAGELTQGHAIAVARFENRAARRRYEIQRASLVMEIVGRYTELQQWQQQAAADQLSVTRNEMLRRRVAAKESVGRATHLDTLRADLLLGEARSRQQNNAARLAASSRALAEAIGAPLASEFELQAPGDSDDAAPSGEAALRTAYARRLELAQAQDNRDFAERNLSVSRKALLPDLRLIVGYRDEAPLVTEPGATTALSRGFFVGLSADTDFNRERAGYRVEQARLDALGVAQSVEIARTLIEREVSESLQERSAARTGVELAQANLALAQGRLDLAQRLFEMGRADTFDVTSAEEQFQQVASQLLMAKGRLTQSGYGVSRALGTLLESPADLRPVEVAIP